MAIQNINLGTAPTGAGGDTFRSAAAKINANFSNAAHAASREIGKGSYDVSYNMDIHRFINTLTPISELPSPLDVNQLPINSAFQIVHDQLNTPSYSIFGSFLYRIETKIIVDRVHQFAYGHQNAECLTRHTVGTDRTEWTEWLPIGQSRLTYKSTTAAGANVVVDADGKLMRSTSSERYKDILAPLALDDITYNKAMNLSPIVYRSTAEADNPNHHYYSFSAEALGEVDKAFTLWRNTETVEVTKLDADGNEYLDSEEVALEVPVAEGLNINALLAFSHAISIKQDKLIKSLEARIEALEAAIPPINEV